ncbi:MAG: TRAP transporter small permease [Clostridiaceae bacterium]|nr:TRAP transporter small permease [Clostridiaceae bacterium]
MKGISKYIEITSKMFNGVSCILIFATMVLVIINILLRALFKNPITGIYDILMMFSIVMISVALAYCHLTDGHVNITFIIDKLPQTIRKLIVAIIDLIGIALFGGIGGYILAYYVQAVRISGEATLATRTPLYPFYYILALGLLVLIIVALLKCIRQFKKEGVENER